MKHKGNACSRRKARKTLDQSQASLSKDVYERCTSTGKGFLEFLGIAFAQIFKQIFSIRVNKLSKRKWCSVEAY